MKKLALRPLFFTRFLAEQLPDNGIQDGLPQQSFPCTENNKPNYKIQRAYNKKACVHFANPFRQNVREAYTYKQQEKQQEKK